MKHLIKIIFLVTTLNLSAQSTSTAKVYTKGNYFIIEQNGKLYPGVSKNVEVYQTAINGEFYYFTNLKNNWPNHGLKIENIVDGTETPYTAGSWETFYTENTGNFNAGGGDGKLGSQTPEEVALAMYVDVTAALAGGLVSKQLYHTGDYILRMIP